MPEVFASRSAKVRPLGATILRHEKLACSADARRTIEQMLENMFVGRPTGNYDRLLDFSRAVTGSLFFVPSATFLEALTEDQPAVPGSSAAPLAAQPSPSIPSVHEGSLGIGSLKRDIRHE